VIAHDCATVPGLGIVAQSCGRFRFPTDDSPAHHQRGRLDMSNWTSRSKEVPHPRLACVAFVVQAPYPGPIRGRSSKTVDAAAEGGATLVIRRKVGSSDPWNHVRAPLHKCGGHNAFGLSLGGISPPLVELHQYGIMHRQDNTLKAESFDKLQ
jgi:hypothetical protein